METYNKIKWRYR